MCINITQRTIVVATFTIFFGRPLMMLKGDAFDIHLKSLSKSANVPPYFTLLHKDTILHSHEHAETTTRRRTLQDIGTAISYTTTYTLFPVHRAYATEPKECDNGMIVSETSVPGAYQQVCMSLPTRSLKLKTTGETITIFQGVAADDDDKSRGNNSKGLVSGRTGVALWNSGVLLTRLLDLLETREEQGFLKDKVVLELGCGPSMASIAASKLGAKRVIATDGNEEVVDLARRNLEFNNIFPNDNGREELPHRLVGQASYLKWGSLDIVDFYDSADIVIGSDLTYNSGSWGALADTVESVLKPNGIFLYVTLGHSGFNVASEVNGFLTLVESKGVFEIVREGTDAWPFQNVQSLEALLGTSLDAREKEVVSSTGGFKVLLLRKKLKRR
jgi:SAM-dependent methyltransferase